MAQVKALVEKLIADNGVVVFSKSYCPYCSKAKGLLSSLKVDYRAFELDEDAQGGAVQEYLQQRTGQRTVPNIFIKGAHVGGCDDLHQLHARNELLSKV